MGISRHLGEINDNLSDLHSEMVTSAVPERPPPSSADIKVLDNEARLWLTAISLGESPPSPPYFVERCRELRLFYIKHPPPKMGRKGTSGHFSSLPDGFKAWESLKSGNCVSTSVFSFLSEDDISSHI